MSPTLVNSVKQWLLKKGGQRKKSLFLFIQFFLSFFDRDRSYHFSQLWILTLVNPFKKVTKTLNFETFFITNLNLDSHFQVGFTGIWLFWNPLSFDGLSHISRKLNFEALFRVRAPASKFHRFIKLVGDQSKVSPYCQRFYKQ